MSQEPWDRSSDAGKRLRILRKRAFDKSISQTDLCGSKKNIRWGERWQKIVEICDPKRIGDWENNGVPFEKLNSVAEFFYLEREELIDSEIEIDDLIKKVRQRIRNPELFDQKKILTDVDSGKTPKRVKLNEIDAQALDSIKKYRGSNKTDPRAVRKLSKLNKSKIVPPKVIF